MQYSNSIVNEEFEFEVKLLILLTKTGVEMKKCLKNKKSYMNDDF